MKSCCICLKKNQPGNGTFFAVPKEKDIREKWQAICTKRLTPFSKVCADHFRSVDIVSAGRFKILLPCAMPFVQALEQRPSDVNNQKSYSSNIALANQSHCKNVTAILKKSQQRKRQLFEVATTERECAQSGNKYIFSPDKPEVQNSCKEQWKLYKEQGMQTEPVIFVPHYEKYIESKKQLEKENKELKRQLSEANLAINYLEKIFTGGQIQK